MILTCSLDCFKSCVPSLRSVFSQDTHCWPHNPAKLHLHCLCEGHEEVGVIPPGCKSGNRLQEIQSAIQFTSSTWRQHVLQHLDGAWDILHQIRPSWDPSAPSLSFRLISSVTQKKNVLQNLHNNNRKCLKNRLGLKTTYLVAACPRRTGMWETVPGS